MAQAVQVSAPCSRGRPLLLLWQQKPSFSDERHALCAARRILSRPARSRSKWSGGRYDTCQPPSHRPSTARPLSFPFHCRLCTAPGHRGAAAAAAAAVGAARRSELPERAGLAAATRAAAGRSRRAAGGVRPAPGCRPAGRPAAGASPTTAKRKACWYGPGCIISLLARQGGHNPHYPSGLDTPPARSADGCPPPTPTHPAISSSSSSPPPPPPPPLLLLLSSASSCLLPPPASTDLAWLRCPPLSLRSEETRVDPADGNAYTWPVTDPAIPAVFLCCFGFQAFLCGPKCALGPGRSNACIARCSVKTDRNLLRVSAPAGTAPHFQRTHGRSRVFLCRSSSNATGRPAPRSTGATPPRRPQPRAPRSTRPTAALLSRYGTGGSAPCRLFPLAAATAADPATATATDPAAGLSQQHGRAWAGTMGSSAVMARASTMLAQQQGGGGGPQMGGEGPFKDPSRTVGPFFDSVLWFRSNRMIPWFRLSPTHRSIMGLSRPSVGRRPSDRFAKHPQFAMSPTASRHSASLSLSL